MKRTNWNKNEVRKFLDKLENYWGYPFDYENEICTGNFVCLARTCDKVLFFSDICSENYDCSYVKMRLIYTYLIYSKNHVVMRMAQCQGQSGLYHALASSLHPLFYFVLYLNKRFSKYIKGDGGKYGFAILGSNGNCK